MSPQCNDRFHATDRGPDQRRPGQRDRDRVLYTSALRRLAGVTQVVSASEGLIFHNRLTHTLEVAQISRRLAEMLLGQTPSNVLTAVGGLDPEVAEASALAHDLGHPPFGHVVEKELNALVSGSGVFDGFEGNAQSFRVVTKLARRNESFAGLNLTRGTLNAILKYPWFRTPEVHKWGAYYSERMEFEWARELFLSDPNKSAEAELMDWADDVAYSVHDVEDFYRAGLIPIDRMILDTDERERFLTGALRRLRSGDVYSRHGEAALREAFNGLADLFPINELYNDTLRQRSLLRSWTAGLVGRYIVAISLTDPNHNNGKRASIASNAEAEVNMLKQLTWHYVIDNPALDTQQYGQRRVVRDLFEIYHEATNKREDSVIFPVSYREQLEDASTSAERIRIVTDLLASMTEQQLLSMHRRLTGVSLGSVLDAIGS